MSLARDDPVEQTRHLLNEVPGLKVRVSTVVRQAPTKGSNAAIDQDRFGGVGSYPWVFVGQMLGVAVDHAQAWARLLESHQMPLYAHLTLLRAALEAAVTARWLLSAPTTEGRVAAAVSLWEEDLLDWERLVVKFPGKVAPDSSAMYADALSGFRAHVAVAGLPTKRPPSTSDRVRDFGVHPGPKSDWLFRILSAPAHGSTWSISVGEFGEGVETRVPGARSAKVRAHPLLALNATAIVLATLTTAVADLERYAGIGR